MSEVGERKSDQNNNGEEAKDLPHYVDIKNKLDEVKETEESKKEAVTLGQNYSEKELKELALKGKHKRNERKKECLSWALIFFIIFIAAMISALLFFWIANIICDDPEKWFHVKPENLNTIENYGKYGISIVLGAFLSPMVQQFFKDE